MVYAEKDTSKSLVTSGGGEVLRKMIMYGLPTAFVVPTLDWRFFVSSLRAACHTLINIGPIGVKMYACVSVACLLTGLRIE